LACNKGKKKTQQREEKLSTNIGKYSVQIIIKDHYKVACVIIENKYDNGKCFWGWEIEEGTLKEVKTRRKNK